MGSADSDKILRRKPDDYQSSLPAFREGSSESGPAASHGMRWPSVAVSCWSMREPSVGSCRQHASLDVKACGVSFLWWHHITRSGVSCWWYRARGGRSVAAWRGLCNDVVLQVHAQQGACACILHVNLSRTQGHYTTSCQADHLQHLPVLIVSPPHHLLHIVAQPGSCFPCSNAVATGDMRILEISSAAWENTNVQAVSLMPQCYASNPLPPPPPSSRTPSPPPPRDSTLYLYRLEPRNHACKPAPLGLLGTH